MDQYVLSWLKNNVGKTFPSQRKKAFPVKILDLNIDQEEVRFEFVGGKSNALPLFFWMFDRTLEYLRANNERFVMLGTRVQPPYDDDTVEGEIWREPTNILHHIKHHLTSVIF